MKINIKSLLAIGLLMFITTSYSQISRAEVFYKQMVVEDIFDSLTIKEKDRANNGYLSIINNSLRKYSGDFEYKLTINQYESIYKMVEMLQNDNDFSFSTALNLSEADNIYYTNIKMNERLIQKPAFGKKFIIKSNLNNPEWELHKETKIIGKYTCFKATTIKTVKNTAGTFKTIVTAWYAPEISLNFGPKGYGNLPGLIVELQEKNLKYFVSKLILNSNKTIVIEKPTKGELVTENEFEKIGLEATKRIGKF